MTKAMLPDLIDKISMLGKIANNLEMHGEDWAAGFTLPGTMMLTPEELNAIFGDKYFDRCVFNKVKGVLTVCDWLRACKPIALSESYEDAVVLMTISGDRELEFEGCKFKDLVVTFDAKYGGAAELAYKLYLQPGIGKANLQLQEHQHREVKLTITNATVMLKAKSKQQDLPLSSAGEGEEEHPDPDAEEELTHPEQLFEKPKKRRGRKGKNGEAATH